MFEFHKVSFEVKIRQNVGETSDTIKNKECLTLLLRRQLTQRMFPPGPVQVL